MLDATLKTQLKAYLEKVVQPIEMVASLDDSAKAREMEELLLIEIVPVERQDHAGGARRCGAQAIVQHQPCRHRYRRAFRRIPMGHEFTSLVLALLQVGGHPSSSTPP
jgi:alkyl hydroperoxide reductase subunit F